MSLGIRNCKGYLWKGCLFGGRVGGIEPDHVGQDESVGKTVRKVKESTELMGHRVANTQERVGECKT